MPIFLRLARSIVFLLRLFFTSYQLFIGGSGNITPLHAGITGNFHIQVEGEKVFRIVDTSFNPLINPVNDRTPLIKSKICLFSQNNLEEFPEKKYLNIYEAHLKPGDILFNPPLYWHNVVYKSASLSLGVRFIDPIRSFKASPMLCLILLSASNPSILSYYFKVKNGEIMEFDR